MFRTNDVKVSEGEVRTERGDRDTTSRAADVLTKHIRIACGDGVYALAESKVKGFSVFHSSVETVDARNELGRCGSHVVKRVDQRVCRVDDLSEHETAPIANLRLSSGVLTRIVQQQSLKSKVTRASC